LLAGLSDDEVRQMLDAHGEQLGINQKGPFSPS
jgi:hypothetical protein